ncbi:MAG: dihydroorotate dehydrogenase electron transfer subunit [Paludibacteraceae bacterium]
MEKTVFKIISNKPLTKCIYEMCLEGNTAAIKNAGQFVNIALDGFYLRRPISVCDFSENFLKIIYKIVGKGTELMAKMQSGEQLEMLTGLGNGFSVNNCQKPLLVGGGVGVPPMYRLAKDLVAQGKQVSVVLGFNTCEEIFYKNEFEALGANVYVATADGSVGTKGFVTDAIAANKIEADYFYACGPLPMLRALYNALDIDGEMSFEERMGCGFGVCMGCSCKTKNGYKRICKEGPVLKKDEIVW